jgi:anti-sigma factor ChrR (cupin superfamily)
MITEQQQEQAALFALGMLNETEQQQFAAEVRASAELREFLWSLARTVDRVALTAPRRAPPAALKDKLLARIEARPDPSPVPPRQTLAAALAGLRFVPGSETSGWKPLPVRGAWIKLLSFEPQRGYAVLLGKLEPGVRYPAHTNAGPEDFFILTGDLHVSDRVLGPGDFHHADAGSFHQENYSVEGCTLLAVLTADDPLVAFAMAPET